MRGTGSTRESGCHSASGVAAAGWTPNKKRSARIAGMRSVLPTDPRPARPGSRGGISARAADRRLGRIGGLPGGAGSCARPGRYDRRAAVQGAVQLDRPAELLDEAAHDVQAEAGAAVAPRVRPVRLPEHLEDGG